MGSYTGYSALYYTGRLTYDDINVGNEGTYHKFNTDINHIQSLGHTVNLHINLHSQLASKDLDGSEQFSLGGADGIRAIRRRSQRQQRLSGNCRAALRYVYS